MPVKLIGKKSPFTGNLLFEILNNLKNYGVGRVILRNSFKKYPEISFYIIRKVIPMRETIGTGLDELVYGKVWVDEIFRGRKLEGRRMLTNFTYYPDFKLIPREDESKYLNFESNDVLKILPRYGTLPPVLAKVARSKNCALRDAPEMEMVYNDLSEHLIYKIAEEGETPNYKLKVQLPPKFSIGIKT